MTDYVDCHLLLYHVIICHLLAYPPSSPRPSGDDVIYEQPLRFSDLNIFVVFNFVPF